MPQRAVGTPGANGRGGVHRFEPGLFGKYYLLQRIGIGGMAEVVRAKTVGAGGFQKELVIKRVLPKFAKDETFVRMFVNEAKIAVGLSHPNIAQILELGQIDGVYFMAIELVDGVDLAELAPLFREGASTMSIDDAVWLVFETLKGLDYAHRKTDPIGRPLGIVHCDISPDNVMVTFDAGVKILDFGIAKVATSLSNRQEGMVMGKVNFLPPEQALGREVDHRSDVYSAGAVLYHLVTGDYPYGKFGTLEDLVPLVTGAAQYVPSMERSPRVPEELDAILRRAVALEPGRRYPDARAFMMALEEVIYPTPHSAIAEHIRTRISESFREKKSRLTRLRANDATVMRILARRIEDGTESERPGTGEHEAIRPPPQSSEMAAPPREVQTGGRSSSPKKRAIEAPWWHVSAPQVVLALVAALVMAWAYQGVAGVLFARGVIIVESEPSGARAFLGGTPLPGLTPIVIDSVHPRKGHDIRIVLDDYETWTGSSPGNGEVVQRVRARLMRRIGPIAITSAPTGAQVFLNEEPLGRTPLTIERFDLIGPSKIGLERPGFEKYEVVLQNIEAGHELHHQLERRTGRR